MVRWVWSEAKAQSNRSKHRVSFAFAARALDDPLRATRLDDAAHEERWQTIGRPVTDSDVLLFIVHTAPSVAEDGEMQGRIISARRATSVERRAYEEGEF